MIRSAVLLPARLETRFDDGVEGYSGTRLRVLVVPDGCWIDGSQPAKETELDLLEAAVVQAGGRILGEPGSPATEAAAAAFDALARQVAPGRAFWLARTFPAHAAGDVWVIDRSAGPVWRPGDDPSLLAPRVVGLPDELSLWASRDDHGGSPVRLDGHPTVSSFPIQADDEEEHVLGWEMLSRLGLTFDVDLGTADPFSVIAADAIKVLYVVGLGSHEADDLFARHNASGRLAVVRPGTPTNTVAGQPAADLGRDPEAWRRLVERDVGNDEYDVSRALTGNGDVLGPLLGSGGSFGQYDLSNLLVPMLWPALASTTLREVWAVHPYRQYEAVYWAAGRLCPGGPLPPIRIGTQPYGIWPCSAYSDWVTDDQVESSVVRAASIVGSSAAALARERLGTVVGADADRLWELLAQTPTSPSYEVRATVPIKAFGGNLTPDGVHRVERWWRATYNHVAERIGPIALDLMPIGRSRPVDLGIVLPPVAVGDDGRPLFLPRPDMHPDEAERLVRDEPAAWLASAFEYLRDAFLDDGLLEASLYETVDWWPASLLWRLSVLSGFMAIDAAHRYAFNPTPGYDPERPLLDRLWAPFEPATSSHRTLYGEFKYRLHQLSEPRDLRFVDDLEREVRGLLDTSSHRPDPWLTAAATRRLSEIEEPRPLGLYAWVDRPKTGTPGPDPRAGVVLAPSDLQARAAVVLRDKAIWSDEATWDLDLSSAPVRDAVRLADEVRTGAHPAEALGREVERLVVTRTKIDGLRDRFRLRPEHAGRRTCDGHAVLEAALADDPEGALAAAGLDADDIAAVQRLDVVRDTYADLLVAGAAQHLVERRPDAAARAMDAAAGLALPPDLELLSTRRQGWTVRTTVLSTAPAAAEPTVPSPVALASPAAAAWLAEASGGASGPAWTWRVEQPDGQTVARTAADCRVHPADAVVVDDAGLDAMVLALTPGTIVARPAGPGVVRRVAALAGTRPPTGSDLGLDDEQAIGDWDATITAWIGMRIAALVTAALDLVDRLGSAPSDSDVAEAIPWNLGALDGGPGSTAAAAAVLQARVDAVPADVGPLGPQSALGALLALVGAKGTVPILADIDAAALSAASRGLTVDPALDTAWLEQIAAVRPAMARIEAHQVLAALDGRPLLQASTSHPGDPWLTSEARPARGSGRVPVLVVSYGPSAVPTGGPVGVGVVDSWAERIPGTGHKVGAAVRFNAPGSRAPQAVIVAVPPDRDAGLDVETVLRIVTEARSSAHARMVRPEDLAPLDVVLPAGVLPAFERGGFQAAARASMDAWPS